MVMVDRMADLQGRLERTTRGALEWWLGELAAMVPERLRRRIVSLRSRLILVVDESGAKLVSLTGDQRETIGGVDLDSPQSIQRLLKTASQGADHVARVSLSVPAERALRTSFTLPLAAERNLDQVVGFEFERVVPFKRDEAYYTYRILSRDKTSRSLDIELAVIQRDEIDAIIQAAQRGGLHVGDIEIASQSRLDPPSVIAIEQAEGRATPSRVRMVMGVLGGCALVLAVASIAVPFIRADRELNALSAQIAAVRHDAEESAALEKRIEAERQGRMFLIDRRRQKPTVTELLDTVTRLTPDDTWLTEFQVEGDEIDLAGASKSATNLLGLIDQSPSFANAAFRASITQDAGLGREHFDISAKIVPRQAK